jgi:hypothetical protein
VKLAPLPEESAFCLWEFGIVRDNEDKSLARKEKTVLTRTLLMEGLRFVLADKKSPVTCTIIDLRAES